MGAENSSVVRICLLCAMLVFGPDSTLSKTVANPHAVAFSDIYSNGATGFKHRSISRNKFWILKSEPGKVSDEDFLKEGWIELFPDWINHRPKLSARSYEILKDSWEGIKYHPPGISGLSSDFYDILFDEAPQLRVLFKLEMAEQHHKLAQALDLAIHMLVTDEYHMLKEVKELAERHVGYGARSEHYAAFGTCLLKAIKKYNTLTWNEELEEAWVSLLSLILCVVIPAAWEAEREQLGEHMPDEAQG